MNSTRTNLSVNLNKVALLRNQRDVGYPSPLQAARIAIEAGAHGVTVHPRPDERHVRASDVPELAALVREEYAGRVEYNIEGNPEGKWLALVREVRPDQATLVPDLPCAHTSDAGWDVPANRARLREVIAALKDLGIRVSLFVEADPAAMAPAREVGADRVELYTGPYAQGFIGPERETALARYVAAAEAARDAGLGVNAGHDLNLDNLGALKRAIPWLAEVSIGHAITSDALWMGLAPAVRAYLAALAGDEAQVPHIADAYSHRPVATATAH